MKPETSPAPAPSLAAQRNVIRFSCKRMALNTKKFRHLEPCCQNNIIISNIFQMGYMFRCQTAIFRPKCWLQTLTSKWSPPQKKYITVWHKTKLFRMYSNFQTGLSTHNRGLLRLLSRNSERYVQNTSLVFYDWASLMCKCLMHTVRQDCHQIWDRGRKLSHFKDPLVMKQDGSLLFLSCASGLCGSGTHRSVSQQVGHEPVAAWFKFGSK